MRNVVLQQLAMVGDDQHAHLRAGEFGQAFTHDATASLSSPESVSSRKANFA